MRNRVRELHEARGWAQQGLAVRAGVSPTLIVSVEKWGYKPTERIREKIAAALGCAHDQAWPRASREEADVADVAP